MSGDGWGLGFEVRGLRGFRSGGSGPGIRGARGSGPGVAFSSLGLAASGSSVLTYSLNGTTIEAGQSASRATLDAVNSAIASLASTRGTLGAAESRLNVAINNLSVARENFAAAESQIRDTDVAQQAAELTRLGILQQAGSAVLAQANQQPALALTLLG